MTVFGALCPEGLQVCLRLYGFKSVNCPFAILSVSQKRVDSLNVCLYVNIDFICFNFSNHFITCLRQLLILAF